MDFDKFDRVIGDTLAANPTTRQNQDHLMRIEEDLLLQLDADVRAGLISVDFQTLALITLHKQIHPTAP